MKITKEHADITMQEIPPLQRPYEKCEAFGPEALSDAELLAILLRTGSANESALRLAERILSACQGLPGLLQYALPELMELRGVGRVKGVAILALGELSKRIWQTTVRTHADTFRDARSIAGFYMESMRHLDQEELHVMLLNWQCILLRDCCLYRGTAHASLCSPREVLREALRHRASLMVLIHNHPGGSCAPSKEDITLTDSVRQAGELMQIPLLDHVIIGDQQYFSFKEEGLL